MNIIELFKKVGLLRYGTEKGPRPIGEFYGSESKSDKPAADNSRENLAPPSASTPSTSATQAATSTSPIYRGRIIAFGVTVVIAILAAVLFLLGIGFNTGFVVLVVVWVGFLWFANRFAFKGSSSWLGFLGLFAVILFLDFMIMGFTAPDAKTLDDSQSALSIEQIRFAKPGPNGELDPVDSATFTRGEEVHLVLIRVAGFQAGSDGRHWYDLDAKLTGPDGQVVVQGVDILGEAGHRTLPEGVAKAPEAQFKTAAHSPVGAYTITLTIKDKIRGSAETITRAFTLQ